MRKAEQRRFIRSQKAELQPRFAEWSADICRQVMAMKWWQQATSVLLYHALPDEPDLQPLLDVSLSEGKQVLLPVVVGDDLVVRHYLGPASLREGAFHILEPTGSDFPLTRYGEIGLALVPGLAFDSAGHRLGRGRGYYDRLLPRIPQARLLGVCFPFQYVSAVPAELHDIPVHAVVVPKHK